MASMRIFLYLFSVFVGIIYAFFAVFFVTEALVPSVDISDIDYRLVLLKRVEGPRVLIDSGSNSFWSIYPEMFSEIIGLPSFVIAENGSVPIDFKIRKLQKYLRDGDIVVLPLEYVFYQKNEVTSSFLEQVFGDSLKGGHDLNENVFLNIMNNYAYHYHMMSFIEKLHFIHKYMNLDVLIDARRQRLREPSVSTQLKYRLDHLKDVAERQAGGDVKDDANRIRHRLTRENSCYDFIQPYPTQDESVIENIASKLGQIQKENGTTFVITWPAVAGLDCYRKADLDRLREQVRRIFESKSIQVIGDPEDSNFNEEHLLDTYFHVDSAAARVRTQKLASHLRVLMDKRYLPRKSTPLKFLVEKAVREEAARADIILARSAARVSSGEYFPNDPAFPSHFHLSSEGWSVPENWGVWSLGSRSRIFLRAGIDDCALTIKGRQFLHSASTFRLITQDGKSIDFSNSVYLPRNSGMAVIDIAHYGAASPRLSGLAADDRVLGYGLEKISIECLRQDRFW